MGVSVHVTCIRPPTAEYKKKLRAYKSCIEAEVTPPRELCRFFEDRDDPSEDGMETDLPHEATDGEVEYGEGMVIDLAKLPPGTTRLRVYMS